MPRINQDPKNVTCPDFAGAVYATIRQVMANNGQIDNNLAIKQLTAAWNQAHEQEVEAWNLQAQANLKAQEAQTRLAEEDEERC